MNTVLTNIVLWIIGILFGIWYFSTPILTFFYGLPKALVGYFRKELKLKAALKCLAIFFGWNTLIIIFFVIIKLLFPNVSKFLEEQGGNPFSFGFLIGLGLSVWVVIFSKQAREGIALDFQNFIKPYSTKPKPLWGEPLTELIRKITGIDKDLPIFTLMGLPEATVISVVDGYFCYKANKPYLADKDIFQRILKARCYDSKTEEEILKANPRNLLEFVKLILKAEGQADELSSESINNLILKYREFRGIK